MTQRDPEVPAQLADFPQRPVHELLPHISNVCRAYELRPHEAVTVESAYETALEEHAPLVTHVSALMLQGITRELEAEPRRTIGIVSRDGLPFGAAFHGLRPELMRTNGVQFRWSRILSELMMQDWELRHGRQFPLDETAFRGWRHRVDPHAAPGTIDNAKRYFERIGFPVEPGAKTSLVDIGARGAMPEIFRHTLALDASIHLAKATTNAALPRPETVHGYLFHIQAEQLGPVNYMPDDPRLTLLNNQATAYLEALMSGPQTTVVGMTSHGPQAEARQAPSPATGLAPEWGSPRVVSAMRTAVLLATYHHASQFADQPLSHVAEANKAGRDRFAQQVRNLITGHGPYNATLAAMMQCDAPRLVTPPAESQYRAVPSRYAQVALAGVPAQAPRKPGSAVATTHAATFHHDHLGRSVREIRSLSKRLAM